MRQPQGLSDRPTESFYRVPCNLCQTCTSRADIVVPEHESSIFRSFIQPCMWFLHDGTGQALCCLASGELAWHFQNHIQGWMNDLNMLLSCFRTKMSAQCLFSSSPSFVLFLLLHSTLSPRSRSFVRRGNSVIYHPNLRGCQIHETYRRNNATTTARFYKTDEAAARQPCRLARVKLARSVGKSIRLARYKVCTVICGYSETFMTGLNCSRA